MQHEHSTCVYTVCGSLVVQDGGGALFEQSTMRANVTHTDVRTIAPVAHAKKDGMVNRSSQIGNTRLIECSLINRLVRVQ